MESEMYDYELRSRDQNILAASISFIYKNTIYTIYIKVCVNLNIILSILPKLLAYFFNNKFYGESKKIFENLLV